METLELPIAQEKDESNATPVSFADQEIDLAAFELWREASRPDTGAEEEIPEALK